MYVYYSLEIFCKIVDRFYVMYYNSAKKLTIFTKLSAKFSIASYTGNAIQPHVTPTLGDNTAAHQNT